MFSEVFPSIPLRKMVSISVPLKSSSLPLCNCRTLSRAPHYSVAVLFRFNRLVALTCAPGQKKNVALALSVSACLECAREREREREGRGALTQFNAAQRLRPCSGKSSRHGGRQRRVKGAVGRARRLGAPPPPFARPPGFGLHSAVAAAEKGHEGYGVLRCTPLPASLPTSPLAAPDCGALGAAVAKGHHGHRRRRLGEEE